MPTEPARGERDLAVNGHVNVDRFLTVRAFPAADRTVPVLSSRTELGGPAANIARVAARHGVRVGLLARLGDGFPDAFRRELSRAGVDAGGLQRVRGRSTPTCFIVEDRRGGQRTLIEQGPMGDGEGPPIPIAWLRRHAWLHVGTGAPEYQVRLAERARDVGVKVAVDPAQELFYWWTPRSLARLLRTAELLFANRAELAQVEKLVGASGVSALLERVPLIVRTEGPGGATAYSRAGREHVPAAPVRSVQSRVGAGDAFRGGFYGGFFAGRSLGRCLEAGSRASARWIEGAR